MLQDSSFAIHPNHKNDKQEIKSFQVGDLIETKKNHNHYEFYCESGFISLFFYRSDITRIVMNPFKKPTFTESPAIIGELQKTESTFKEFDATIEIKTNSLQLLIQKKPFQIHINRNNGTEIVHEVGMGYTGKGEVFCRKKMYDDDHYYGFGEKTGYLDKRGEEQVMWNSDVYAPHNPETNSLYQSIPFFITLRNALTYGLFFDNTWKTSFDMKTKTDEYVFSASGGQLDYYVMAGPSFKQVLEQYTYLTGNMPLPPKWALGYQQSRYSYQSEEEVREIIDTFKKKKIPLDVVYLDIHYMDEYRVFTFDPNRFPDPEELIRDLAADGKRVVTIVDPGVKKDPSFPIYREGIEQGYFCKYLEGDVYIDEVWPGESAFPDFSQEQTRDWWGKQHQFYTDKGVAGIWNDMNEPAVFNESKTMDLDVVHQNDGDLKTHQEYHNLYGFQMGRATYEGLKKINNQQRPFLVTRAGYAGIQRYAAVWTGDNRSFWEHLQMSLPMCMNLGLSGVPFCGPDVGGFAHDANGELLTRWTQVGAFTPFFRNHSAIDSIRQEPWVFGEPYESIIKKYIELRYSWFPHLYSLFYEASQSGIPVMRPLVLEYPDDEETYNLYDQFMVGPNVIIAPIMTPDTKKRMVYLPKGEWIDYWTDEKYQGAEYHIIKADLDTLPIFIKSGSFIALGPVHQSTAEKNNEVTIHYYLSQEVQEDKSIVFYEDDGESFNFQSGDFLRLSIVAGKDNDGIHFSIKMDGNKQYWSQVDMIIHNCHSGTNVYVNHEEAVTEELTGNKLRVRSI